MNKIITPLLFLLIIASCGETPTPEAIPAEPKADTSSKTTKKKKIKKPPADLITNENVKEKLLAYGEKNPETIVDVYTTKGKVRMRLFKDTPLHRANFILMTKKGYFEGTVFTRVRQGFIAQGGGAYDEKNTKIRASIGRYTIPAEFSKQHFHKQGAVGAARRYVDNPDKRSDPSAFYFVEGVVFNEPTLQQYEETNKYQYSQTQRDYYLNNPGAAHIDGEHTVFGEIISGYEVVPKITEVRTDSKDWPKDDIFIDSVVIIK